MAHDSQDFSSPQEAIEGYLEALLQDVAEYDEPEASSIDESSEPAPHKASPVQTEQIQTEIPVSPSEEVAVDEAGAVSAFPDEEGTRVFAPPSAREYAREAAAQIRQRQQSTAVDQPKVDVAFQDAPAIVMPELKVAEPETETKTEAIVEEKVELEPQTVAPEPQVEIAEPEISAADPIADIQTEIEQDNQIAEETALEVKENEGWTDGRPDWAQGRFECLLFVVKGLKLAVPLAELGGIHKLEKEPTPLFGQPGWFLGIVRTNNMNVGLVDTAQWVMSEHINDDHKPDFRFAIRIHNSEWGLACHEVAEAISLDPSEVKWRTSLGRRPWLAGTVVDHMCALIDVAAFARLLDSDKVPVDLQALMADEE